MMTGGAQPEKVVVGFFSFTEVPPAARRAYNEWHQLDHLPSQYPLPGIVYGQRWAGTGLWRSARQVSQPPLEAADYLTIYLMADPLAQTLQDFSDLARDLRAADRFFEERRAVLSGPFSPEGRVAAERVRVSAETVPYRPTRGLYVLVERVEGALAPRRDALEALVRPEGVAGLWAFGPLSQELPPALAGRWKPGSHRVTVWFLDQDPLSVAPLIDPLARSLWEEAGSEPVLAGPFGAIVPWEWSEVS